MAYLLSPRLTRSTNYFLVAVCILFSQVLFLALARAEDCADCEKKFRRSCGENCETAQSKDGYEYCKNQCIEKVCAKTCSVVPRNERASTSFKSGCERCLVRAQGAACSDQCGRHPNGFMACLKQCAKTKCVDECDLPDVTAEDDEFRVSDKECSECRDQAYERCRTNTDCVYGEPGFNTCRMACAVKQCSSVCDHF